MNYPLLGALRLEMRPISTYLLLLLLLLVVVVVDSAPLDGNQSERSILTRDPR